MVDTVGSAKVVVSADVSDVIGDLKRVENESKKTSRGVNAGFAKTAKAAVKMGAAIGAVVISAKALQAAVQAMNQAFARGDAFAKASRAIGVTADELIKLEFAASQTGVSADVLGTSMRGLVARIAAAQNGSAEAVRIFENLGLSFEQVASQDTVATLRQAADAISAMGSETQRAAAATLLFGESGSRMVNLLRDGSAGFDELAKKAEDAGISLKNVDLGQIEAANDAVDTIQRSFEALSIQLAADFAPVIKDVATGLISASRAARELFVAVGLITEGPMIRLIEAQKDLAKEQEKLTSARKRDQRVGRGGIADQEARIAKKQREIEAIQQEVVALEKRRAEMKQQAAIEQVEQSQQPDFSEDRLSMLSSLLVTEREMQLRAIQDTYTERLALIDELEQNEMSLAVSHAEARQLALEDKLLSEAELLAQDMEATRQVEEEKTRITEREAERRRAVMQTNIAMTQSLLGGLTTLMQTESRKAFEIGKAASIAETIINTIQAAQNAYTWASSFGGPPAGAAAAAVAGAAGFARVQQISSTGMGSRGTPATGGGAFVPPTTVNPNETTNNNVQNITGNVTLVGDSFSADSVRGLMTSLSEQLGDNVTLRAT